MRNIYSYTPLFLPLFIRDYDDKKHVAIGPGYETCLTFAELSLESSILVRKVVLALQIYRINHRQRKYLAKCWTRTLNINDYLLLPCRKRQEAKSNKGNAGEWNKLCSWNLCLVIRFFHAVEKSLISFIAKHELKGCAKPMPSRSPGKSARWSSFIREREEVIVVVKSWTSDTTPSS